MTAGYKSEKTITIWNLTENKPVNQLVNKSELRTIDVSGDGVYVYAGGHSGVFVWDLRKTDEPVSNLAR